MDIAVTSLLVRLHQLGEEKTAVGILEQIATLLCDYLTADSVIGYELIPDTGGVPRLAPVVVGACNSRSHKTLGKLTHTGLLSDFIRHWQPRYEVNAPSWVALSRKTGPIGRTYAQFLAAEKIQAFAFLPIGHDSHKLAVLLLNYRQATSFPPEFQQTAEACMAIASLYMGQLRRDTPTRQKTMAVAHTFYGSIAATFAGNMAGLEQEIHRLFSSNGHTPSARVQTYLENAKSLVFHAMRSLVIEASGELLVDLQTMPLSKALSTTAAALQRAWPTSQQIEIDIPPIPSFLDEQPYYLRQLVYTLVIEAVGNAIKHGGPAPYIHVDIGLDGAWLTVRVLDHGCGFDPATQPFSEHGLGFWSHYIQRELGGTFRVASQRGGFGTVVEVALPVILERQRP